MKRNKICLPLHTNDHPEANFLWIICVLAQAQSLVQGIFLNERTHRPDSFSEEGKREKRSNADLGASLPA